MLELVSLSEIITKLKPDCSTLLDMLLKRPLDYTAQTRITVEHTSDIDVVFLPETLAYKLFNPFIKQSSNTSEIGSISNLDETVSKNLNDSKSTSLFDCSRFAILLSTASYFSSFIALRFQLTRDLSLKVHGRLMDLLGWELLGSSARIFALFSNEAIEEALRTLAPSKLLQQKPPIIVSDSVQDIASKDIVSFVSTKALFQESVPIGPYEWFLTMPFRYPKNKVTDR